MSQATVLKIAWSACALLWAFVAHANRWSVVLIFGLCVLAVSLGAAAAKDLGRDGAGSQEWIREYEE